MKLEQIHVGTIVNAHGIHGEVKLNPLPEFDPAFLAGYKTLLVGDTPMQVKSARVHKTTVLLTLPGVEDMDAALALKGKKVSIRRQDAHLPKNEYFDAELMGCKVLDEATGQQIGELRRVLNYPAHKVYEVVGEHEYLIPAVPDVFIASVDVEACVVRVHMMKGLATDEN